MMRITAYAISVLLSLSAYCALDRIDADGVTEVGGDASYARMLPRTKADGKLDASLLPPVADWASTPIPRLYYVSPYAENGGNGSPQYPFKSLTTAMGNAPSGSAVIIAPGNCSGSCSLTEGKSLTLCGFCYQTYIVSLTVTVSGTSAIRLCGVRVGNLIVKGGTLRLSMYGSTVDSLNGNAVAVEVTRNDMGSKIAFSRRTYSDAYAGHDTAPKSVELASDTGSASLKFTEGELRVGSEEVAYMSDIASATNNFAASRIAALESEDARIAGLVAAETASRTAADTAITGAMYSAVHALSNSISTVDRNWNSRLVTVGNNITTLSENLSALDSRESGDIRALSNRIESVRSTLAAADTANMGTLRSEISTTANTLRSEMAAIAVVKATNEIDKAKSGIVNDAKTAAVSAVSGSVTALSNRLVTAEGKITTLQGTTGGHTTSINNISNSIKTINSRYVSVTNDLATTKSNLNSSIGTLTQQVSGMSTAAGTDREHIDKCKTAINGIIQALTQIKNGKTWSAVTIPDQISW